MGFGSLAIQALLLHDSLRRAWAVGHRQREIHVPIISGVLAQTAAPDRLVFAAVSTWVGSYADDILDFSVDVSGAPDETAECI